ncbi:MAG: carbamoyltransferase HypF [Sulfurimonas sp.]|uniref:carbamoyltransferase HypF n=1 Tax=Sulfurimonas sp. TaxID=2022749 RepID=UPI00260D04EB|nr:carbamoyltransferase HypF [Sulfurimonas sp.]MDD2652750.1 carbamoyltransferase HypF [Sulfurimonas sp.]MDD3450616.1 carbamoyltransferase HypF [Sulfurimonas sp.]
MIFAIEIRGVVQGVGFRPFIYNLAASSGLKGQVSNNGYGVLILLDATREKVDGFIRQIRQNKPPLSEIDSIKITQIKKTKSFEGFSIQISKSAKLLSSKIPSDIAMCEECESELSDKTNRRFEYPFITCTNCGPRYSIIKNLPYDRKNTSMDEFIMCKKCEAEYKNPQDRRYHAQPIGCHECGPALSLYESNGKKIESENIIDEVVQTIADGRIVAIKGIGGYHLVCDASNDSAVELLRERKRRPSKPFGVMVKDIDTSKHLAYISEKEEALLNSNRRPIVLLQKRDDYALSRYVAPNISQIGLFLAYTPLHYLILQKLERPIVATSANISDEPLCRTYDEIMGLSSVWDCCLEHNREIVNGCDDSVAFVENEKIFMLREARGYAPLYLKLLHKTDKKILSLGANQKSTVAITIEDSVVLSPYIGDLGSLSSVEHFKSHIETLKRIYDFTPDVVVCDKHPNYESTKYAKELKAQNEVIELVQVQHHYAHILATMGVEGIASKVLGVSFDGTGYGDDGNLWGGEFFVCDNSSYKRVGQFKYFRLIGGERAIKEPRRVALSFLFEIYGDEAFKLNNQTINSFSSSEIKTLYTVWKNGLNSPLSSSCGRLFDAVASLLDIVQICSYEGESGLLLESLYDENITEYYEFGVQDFEIDFSQIAKQILVEKDVHVAVSKFFNTIVEIIYDMYKKYDLPLVLSGGVFQNRVLLRLIMRKIPDVILPEMFVANDAAIAYGQAIAALNLKTL